MDNKIAVVTGGGSGIGRAIAERFAKDGANVVIAGRTEASPKETAATDEKISYVVGDITRTETIEQIISVIQERFHGQIWNVTNLSEEDAMKHEEGIASNIPCKRFATPEEVANIAAFLVSDEASYVNGSIYAVDGGQGAYEIKNQKG